MALIKCPECKADVSDRAVACPKCGCPIKESAKCPECGVETPDGAISCVKCGYPLKEAVAGTANIALGSEGAVSSKVGRVSDKWAWVLAFIPIVWTVLGRFVDTTMGSTFFYLIWIIYIMFLAIDFKELKKKGHRLGGWTWSGLLPPVYLFLRASKTNKTFGYAITWCVLFVLSFFIEGGWLLSDVDLRYVSAKTNVDEAPIVINTFENAFLAAVYEYGNPSKIGLDDLIYSPPENSEHWRYDVMHGGRITATSKVKLNGVEAGAKMESAYDANGDCFRHTVDPRLANMVNNFVSSGCGSAASMSTTALPRQNNNIGHISKTTDPRDRKTYRTVKIGDYTWMAENLNYQTSNSWCYDNDNSNCAKYGRLYTWGAAKNACPSGWHLSTREEWRVLIQTAGWGDAGGKMLKANSGWIGNGNGTDYYGFSALPSGTRRTNGSFYGAENYGNWWVSTSGGSAYYRAMNGSTNNVNEGVGDNSMGFSVRCVKPQDVLDGQGEGQRESATVEESATVDRNGLFKDKRDGKTYKAVKIGDYTWMAENLNYQTSGSRCYDKINSNCTKYGSLYPWYAAVHVCPRGWHLPSNAEWSTLVGGKALIKSNIRRNNGFSALPSGYDSYDGAGFKDAGRYGYWWSATKYSATHAYGRNIDGKSGKVNVSPYSMDYGFSVRCIKDR